MTSPNRHARRKINAILHNDFLAFIHKAFQTIEPGGQFLETWHVELLAHYLERVLMGDITRLIVNLQPRSLKSLCASVAFPAWALGLDPTLRIIGASYSTELSGDLSRKCRIVMEADWYREVFRSTRIDPGKNTELAFETTKRGFRLATSVEGTLTGRGGNIIIIDDPLKASDATSEAKRSAVNNWFDQTLFSRLDDKAKDRIIVVMQRLHTDDLTGHLLAKSEEEWTVLNLPAIAIEYERNDLGNGRIFTRKPGDPLQPQREPHSVLKRIERQLGSYVFSAQYQQEPLPLEGGLIKWSWFRFYDAPLEPKEGDIIVASWDTASKGTDLSSYSVCTIWLNRDEDHYLIYVFRERLKFPHLKAKVVELASEHGADYVLIEDKGSGTPLIQQLEEDGSLRPIAVEPEGDKYTRMHAKTAIIERGQVLLPRDAHWLPAFKREILSFPHGSHDDQIDSLSQYLNWENPGMIREEDFLFSEPSQVVKEWGPIVPLAEQRDAPWHVFGLPDPFDY